MSTRAAALWYAGHLGPVLPVEPGGKAPLGELVRRGVLEASRDPKIIRCWFGHAPTANVGVRCDDLLVVDLDVRNDGEPAWLGLVGGREVPATPVQRTATGGVHILFGRPPGDLRGKLCSGVDLLRGCRYFVACPSTRPEGSYSWEVSPRRVPVAPCPDWLAELARAYPPPEPAPMEVHDDDDRRVERARRYLERVPPAISGQGGHAFTFLVAQKIVRGFALNQEQAFAVLAGWNLTCRPPWSERDLRRKVAEAARVGQLPVGALLDGGRAA